MANILFISLGCDKNLVDSELMTGALTKSGFSITNDESLADVVIINTCGFIKAAVKESIEHIIKAGNLKKTGGRLRAVIVAGCMVQRYKDEILKDMPEVDAVVAPEDYGKIASIVNRLTGRLKPGQPTRNDGTENSGIEQPPRNDGGESRALARPPHIAYLKIAEGCDNRCSYCTIWQIKGGYKSRSLESLLREAEGLAQTGARELTIIAQDTALYGVDLYGEPKLHILLKHLSGIDGVKWLRLLYAYPEHITDELIAEMKANPKICNYIDIPVQHANDRILRLMGRRGTRENLERLISKLRHNIPDIILRTTVITGFPGETDAEFGELTDFISKTRFDRLGTFCYSREEGTAAAKMKNQIPARVKRERRDILMRLQNEISSEKLREKIGQTLKVIVDEKKKGKYYGRSYMDCYKTDGNVIFTSRGEINAGEFADVAITGAGEYDLYGKLV